MAVSSTNKITSSLSINPLSSSVIGLPKATLIGSSILSKIKAVWTAFLTLFSPNTDLRSIDDLSTPSSSRSNSSVVSRPSTPDNVPAVSSAIPQKDLLASFNKEVKTRPFKTDAENYIYSQITIGGNSLGIKYVCETLKEEYITIEIEKNKTEKLRYSKETKTDFDNDAYVRVLEIANVPENLRLCLNHCLKQTVSDALSTPLLRYFETSSLVPVLERQKVHVRLTTQNVIKFSATMKLSFFESESPAILINISCDLQPDPTNPNRIIVRNVVATQPIIPAIKA